MLLGLAATTVGLSQTRDANASVFGWFDNFELTLESKSKGLPLTISTYDFDGQKIDQVKAKSADIHTDAAMSKTDKDFNEQSSVIDVDYGNKRMTHVGSTLIAYEGMKNYEDEFSKHINIDDHQKSVPLLNSMYQDFSNQWNSQSKVVMIRSQSGKPIAVFTGDNVSIHQTEMKNATKFVINGHQYLTTDRNGKVFACAWSPHLNIKQVFTQDELNEIRNRSCFKSIAWFNELVARGLEELEEE